MEHVVSLISVDQRRFIEQGASVDQPDLVCQGGLVGTGPETATQVITEIFEANYQMLVRYSLRAIHDRNVAEDVVQQALMMLYKNLCQGTVIDNPKAWIFCVIRRLLHKHARTQWSHAALNEPLSVLESLHPRVVTASDTRLQMDDVAKLYGVLTPREKEVVLLRMSSLKYREIADLLGISPKSVNTLLARGLRKLQRAVQAKAGVPDEGAVQGTTIH